MSVPGAYCILLNIPIMNRYENESGNVKNTHIFFLKIPVAGGCPYRSHGFSWFEVYAYLLWPANPEYSLRFA